MTRAKRNSPSLQLREFQARDSEESFLKHERVVLAATTNSANTLSLYPYQAKAVDTVLKMYKDNPSDRRAFLQMPTGTWLRL